MTESTETSPIAEGLAAPPADGYGQRLAIVLHHEQGAEMQLLTPGVPLTVGRAESALLRAEDLRLSRIHAHFLLSGSQITVEDLGSKNGLWIAGRRVDQAFLVPGDEVLLGGVPARLVALGRSGQSLRLEGDERFRSAVEEELARARQFHRPFALLMVRAMRPHEAGSPVPPGEHLRQWLEHVHGCLRPVDRMAVHDSGAVHVLLPETGPDEAMRIARTLATVHEAKPRLFVGVCLHPGAASTVEELLELSREAAYRASPKRPVEAGPTALWFDSTSATDDSLVVGAAMRELLETARQLAPARVPVLLHGETGTGKEVLARFIHEQGPRKARRMVRLNCGAIPKELVESTLFGHERGAFTGALQAKKGLFEEADGGTVFLDEIGEMPLAAQVALLRVLETGSFCRVGASRELSVDVRVIAATHRDLEEMVAAGGFREDLYYRLNAIILTLPPLRERVDEIEPLARCFLRLANESNGRGMQGIEPEALTLLRACSWPGNVRELKNAIERAVVIARGTLIAPSDLPLRVQAAGAGARPPAPATRAAPSPRAPEPVEARSRMRNYEATLLQEALAATGWNRSEAAKRLGMPVRSLSYRMKVLGLKKP